MGKEKNINELFVDKTFVLTGTLSKFSRNEASEIIEKMGGKTSGSGAECGKSFDRSYTNWEERRDRWLLGASQAFLRSWILDLEEHNSMGDLEGNFY